MEQSLKIHNEIFRKNMSKYGGYEVKTEGDAFMIAFANAIDAVKYCIQIQYSLLEADWPSSLYLNPESAVESNEEFSFFFLFLFSFFFLFLSFHTKTKTKK